ncbi:YhfX family PLP-dependent enzyme [Vibrio aestuarianus]|uniref:YhfX family PLP-dependent enzyme n=1 Tax=Vibrio aestuarianus TaxID=28171 RepID=A0A9X4F1J5_9VIBR|nr:YhfX family PLP-dependent enzyme [Vibrio aestuarianus]MDE1242599.1 YhfX family PLP-dependent enzyme [Vibrio aestuarianus]
MFLNALQLQNSGLMEVALALHAEGKVLPDSYIIDVDQFRHNATIIKSKADEYGIKLYGMSKQYGRNPVLSQILIELGYEGIVAVDFKEARTLHKAGVKISHLGHLVQVPDAMLKEVICDIKPEVITIYSIEKALKIAQIAHESGLTQKILLKFYQDGDMLYINQESGFKLSDMDAVMAKLSGIDGIELEGLTHFPCFLYTSGTTEPTKNTHSLIKAKNNWPEELPLNQVNMPSATSCETLPLIKKFGGTHGEPGHALTGTSPANADGSQPEKIAMLYLSEISHQFNDVSYCYAGGYYRRGKLDSALINGKRCKAHNDDESSIDYHLSIEGIHKIGSPVLMAFRTQIFVTRSDVVLVEGIKSGKPCIIGQYTALGERIDV